MKFSGINSESMSEVPNKKIFSLGTRLIECLWERYGKRYRLAHLLITAMSFELGGQMGYQNSSFGPFNQGRKKSQSAQSWIAERFWDEKFPRKVLPILDEIPRDFRLSGEDIKRNFLLMV